MESCIYQGTLAHRRHHPRVHAFRYRVFMAYLDLAELPGVFDGHPMWSARKPALAWFRRADYLGDPSMPLDDAVRDLVLTRTGRRPAGPIRLLTNLRLFGHCFNPVSFYYCFDEAGEQVDYLVAEVTNTPWGERHAYVSEGLLSRQAKALPVSPFMGMDQHYEWRGELPGPRLRVAISLHEGERRMFDAALDLERRPIRRPLLTRLLLAHPPMSLKVLVGIYSQALRLRLKGLRLQPHPPPRAALPAHKAGGAEGRLRVPEGGVRRSRRARQPSGSTSASRSQPAPPCQSAGRRRT